MNIRARKSDVFSSRMNERNVPFFQERQEVSFRSIPTKYTLMRTVDERDARMKNCYEKTASQRYLSNIDIETELRRQNVRLGCDDSHKFFPSSQSDLYQERNNENTGFGMNQPYPDLFREQRFEQRSMFNVPYIGNDLFNNHTRQQLKNTGN